MDENTRNHHHNTPDVAVTDNRGLTVREIQYHRHPDSPKIMDERITRHSFTNRGLPLYSKDPRLCQTNNFKYLFTLSGQSLLTTGVDNGTTLTLNNAAGNSHLTITATETIRTFLYENVSSAGRLLAVVEQKRGDEADICITERFVYAEGTPAMQFMNLAGALIRHYDTAGLQEVSSVSITGVQLSAKRHLLKDDENPEIIVNWKGETELCWRERLSCTAYKTEKATDATGAILSTIDAMGNIQRITYDVAGMITSRSLQFKNHIEQTVVKSITYSAAGLKLREVHGNGVVTTYMYDPKTQRLLRQKIERSKSYPVGKRTLLDLHYEYDPVGNILKTINKVESAQYWRNQKTTPQKKYIYDSLYQLVSATGREMAVHNHSGRKLLSNMPSLLSDGVSYTNYTRTYNYDSGNNLRQIRHHSPATGNSYTINISISDRSNRMVLEHQINNPENIEAIFTAGGNQTQLMSGVDLSWTSRGELLKVIVVGRSCGESDDCEVYRYDDRSQRILKISIQNRNNSIQTLRALYLPGLELRTIRNCCSVIETRQVITVGGTEQTPIRFLHWDSGKIDNTSNDQTYWNYIDLTGSHGIEVNAQGELTSLEEYYPYGGTAVCAQVEACYKTIRYSGKELDATGLYYFNDRYYQPWIGRWLSADPAGTVDGLNLFRMTRNNPITYEDETGKSSSNRNKNIFKLATFGLRKKSEGAGASLSRGRKTTKAILSGLAVAGFVTGITVATGGIALGASIVIGISAFAVGAVAGWNSDKITTSITGYLSKKLQGKSVLANSAAGAAVGALTATMNGASTQGTAIATLVGGLSGAIGGAVENSDRGLGGAHAAGIAVGTVDMMAGSDASLAMETSAAISGGIGGFITGTSESSSVGEYAGYGSYIGGMGGRYVDDIISYPREVITQLLITWGVQNLTTYALGDNAITQRLGQYLGNATSSIIHSQRPAGIYEWMGSAIGGAIGGVGTALSLVAPDQHFRNRMSQASGLIGQASGYAMGLMSRFNA